MIYLDNIKWKTIGALGLLCSLTVPALAGTPFNVDDPGTAEPHHVQLDLAAITGQVRGSESDVLPSVSFGYGATDTVELDLGLSAGSIRNSGSDRVSGLGDTTAGVKWRFQEETASRPQLAVSGQIKFPTASRSRGLGSGRYDYTPGLSLGKSFGKYAFCAGAGYNFVGDPDAKNNTYYGVCLTYQTTEKTTVGAQIYGNTAAASGQRDELAYGIGATCNYQPNQSLQVMVGRSMHGFSDLNVYAGLEFDFGPKAAPATPAPAEAASEKKG
ncbi:MAG: transporter [Janthinobacterium lividum]